MSDTALHIDGDTITEVPVDPAALAAQAAYAASQAEPSVAGPKLLAAASAACDAITAQIIPSETHKLAYLNAAMIVRANGGNAPTEDPDKSEFAAFAASVGMSADALATVARAVSLASLQLATAYSTLRGSVVQATSAADLTSALGVFEAAIGALVSMLSNAGLTVAVAAPAAITIAGING